MCVSICSPHSFPPHSLLILCLNVFARQYSHFHRIDLRALCFVRCGTTCCTHKHAPTQTEMRETVIKKSMQQIKVITLNWRRTCYISDFVISFRTKFLQKWMMPSHPFHSKVSYIKLFFKKPILIVWFAYDAFLWVWRRFVRICCGW